MKRKSTPPEEEKLRVAVLSKVFPPFSYGGTESYNSELASELANRGDIELHVLCFQSAESPVGEEIVEALRKEKKYTLHIVGRFFKRFRGMRSIINYWKTRLSLSRTLKSIKPRILHTVGVYSETIFALGTARKLGIRTIVHPQGSDINRKQGVLLRFIYRHFVFDRADAVFSLTRKAQKIIEDMGLIDVGKGSQILKVVPNAIDLSLCEEREEQRDMTEDSGEVAFRLLWVGRFEEVKNPALAVELFSLFIETMRSRCDGREGDVHLQLTMIGDGELFGEVQKKASGIEEVVLEGKLAREEVFQFMSKSDVLINTSRSEGFPVTFLEGMAHGLPIICFDVSANAELLKDGENGFVVQEGDGDAFTRKLVELCEKPDLKKRMGRQNRETVRNYDWDHVLSEVVETYKELGKAE